MDEKRKTRWSQKDLTSAIEAIKKENLSLRTALEFLKVHFITIYMASLKLVQNLAPLQS